MSEIEVVLAAIGGSGSVGGVMLWLVKKLWASHESKLNILITKVDQTRTKIAEIETSIAVHKEQVESLKTALKDVKTLAGKYMSQFKTLEQKLDDANITIAKLEMKVEAAFRLADTNARKVDTLRR